MVIGAAVVLFIASLLPYYSYGNSNIAASNSWDSLGIAIGVYMVGVAGAALIVFSRSQPQPRKVAGVDLAQFGVAATVVTAWHLFWTIIDLGQIDAGAGLVLGMIASLVLAAGAVASPLVPALKAPLAGAPKPQAVHPPYGGQPQPGQGYGYPGAQQQSFGGQQPGQPQPYGAQQPGQPEPQQAGAPAQQAPAAGGAPAGDFTPFWFAVPVARPLYGEDGSPAPIAELAPGTWYLAVEQHGPGLIAQTQDGRRGVLQDTTGIQRG
ncbi:hypothetical protein [Streptomyces laculatispora]|uniref:hypothetical protein n=1 Tax=Streptomyces laculatispora TaxID=887464 RepID=UPI001A94B578|nr:hypothetical protein [Streptomyces laculatispora]MBO0915081.1 hypothetical protein [Streptomyces laculatispora]